MKKIQKMVYTEYGKNNMLNLINDMYNNTRKPTGFMKHYYTLYSIVEGLETQNSFEFGTGLSTIIICEALEKTGGKHTSCDIRDITNTGIDPTSCSIYKDRWTYIQKDSRLVTIPDTPLDFVLHDGSHESQVVLHDLKKIVRHMKLNSILMVHDTISDEYSPRLDLIVKDALKTINHEIVTLPYGYGLTIVKILQDFGNGIVTPTWRKS